MNEDINVMLKEVDGLKEQLLSLRPLPEDFQQLVIESEIDALRQYLSIMT